MNYWINNLNQALKSHDSLLYAVEHKIGRIDVYRKSQFGCNPPHLLFSLTENWLPQSEPRHWGIEVVLDRIKAHDLWRDDSFMENYLKQHEKDEESKDRARRNNIESFLYDFRSEFKKTFGDVNTSNMKKLYRKENSNGYCQPRQ